jgi:pimeloyl-ACP methyl ester carboxylesterase
MAAVFVHRNPETAAIWRPLLGALGRRETVTPSPPGFGAPLPADFGATSDDDHAWLVARLETRNDPVDLVGHDWGGGHVLRLAGSRPDLIRSWAIDITGCFGPDCVRHDNAVAWQTANWWMMRDPQAGADALSRFWSTIA